MSWLTTIQKHIPQFLLKHLSDLAQIRLYNDLEIDLVPRWTEEI
jgi:hypothetical protein